MNSVKQATANAAAAFTRQEMEFGAHGESAKWQTLDRESERALVELREALSGLPFAAIDGLASGYDGGSNERAAIRLAVATMTAAV